MPNSAHDDRYRTMNFAEILKGLHDSEIDYVLVGGLAVFLNGISRATLDIDLALAMNDSNLDKFIDFAKKRGLKPRIPVPIDSLKSSSQIETWFREKGMIAFSLVGPRFDDLSIDVLVRPVVPFEELRAHARHASFSGGRVIVASPKDLIRMKQGTGRSVDERDVVLLRDLVARSNSEAKND